MSVNETTAKSSDVSRKVQPMVGKEASVGLDPVHRRGQVCRGAYIVHPKDDTRYLDPRLLRWQEGIDDECWFDTVYDARKFLDEHGMICVPNKRI